MNLKTNLLLLPILLAASAAIARPPVVTFSKGDTARILAEACGAAPRGAAPPLSIHRNSNGSMIYMVSGHQEAILFAETQSCNKLEDDTFDIWRDDQGNPVAQRIRKTEGDLVLVGETAELRGKRFDCERSGNYMVISHGTTSTISAVARPYRELYRMDFDAQRIFARKRNLVVVGGNPRTGQLEARPLRVGDGRVTEDGAIPVAGMPAGVKVLDYSESSDDLLLGGVNPSGQPSFVVVNLGSGSASTVEPSRPGDDSALFLADAKLRARLGGTATGGTSSRGGAPAEKRGKGFFGLPIGR